MSRPLSPHLAIYRWQIGMIASLAHRATGIALVIVAPAAIWLLFDMAVDANHFERDLNFLRSVPGRFLLWGTLVLLSYHLLNGIRFMLIDVAVGGGREAMRRSALLVFAGTLLAATIFGGILW